MPASGHCHHGQVTASASGSGVADPRPPLRPACLLLSGLALTGCGGIQSVLDPASDGAASVAQLWWVMFWGTGVIMLIVVGLTLYTVFRRKHTPMPVSPTTVLIVGGLVWPACVILALLLYAVPLGHRLLPLPTSQDVLRVDVTAHQWWWEFSYPELDGGPVFTANELHIPAGRPVDITIRSADVIHSFWVPRLAGKIDAMPGSPNQLRIQAREPGQFRGQCAEFCGAQHARMAFHVTAHDEAGFAQQLRRLQRSPLSITEDDQLRLPGRAAFDMFCAGCHSVTPTAPGEFGPNLANIADRAWLGAGALRNGEGALLDWLQNHQAYKPGNRMPRHDAISQETLAQIVAFLEDSQ